MFEATHGTAPKYAGRTRSTGFADPLAEMMLRHMGWTEAARPDHQGRSNGAIAAKTVTYDFERLMDGATPAVLLGVRRRDDCQDVGRAAPRTRKRPVRTSLFISASALGSGFDGRRLRLFSAGGGGGAAVVAVAGLMLMVCGPFGPWMISEIDRLARLSVL